MADTSDIIKNISDLGLNEIESRLYHYLLVSGTVSILRLSKDLNIPRTTAYRICDKLVKMNFLEWVVERQGTRVKALSPDQLGTLLQEKRTEVKKMADAISSIKELLTLQPQHSPKTQVRYYYGVSGVKQLVWNSLKAKKEIVGYSAYHRRNILRDDFSNEYYYEAKKRRIIDKSVITDIEQYKKVVAQSYPHSDVYKVRVAENSGLYITGDTYIYNNIYAVTLYKHKFGEIVGVEIENSELVKMQKTIFDYLWQQATPLEEYMKKSKTPSKQMKVKL